MARFLKQGRDADAIAADDAKVRATVEGILADIAARGDAAVRELSVKFDRWDREDFRLTDREIQGALAELTQRDIDDIKFAQAQVRNFAQAQKEALRDIEVETLPGVVLGHKNAP
jgi:sulfopropanediol 3-dehydrogenase